MGMHLGPTDLREIASKIEKLDESEIEVTQIVHRGHFVWLRYGSLTGQSKEGHQVIGISLDRNNDPGKVLR